jgi:EF hand
MRTLSLLALSLVTLAAAAQGLPSFEEVDVNGDGQISRQEAAAIEALDFTAVDTNQDGTLSKEEYEAAADAQ